MRTVTLYLIVFCLTSFIVKAQFMNDIKLPDYLSETEIITIRHFEASNLFESHDDIGLTPFYLMSKGKRRAAFLFAICTMTHEPYLLMVIPGKDKLPTDHFFMTFYNAGGEIKAVFESNWREGQYVYRNGASAFDFAEQAFEGHDSFFFVLFEANNMTLSMMNKEWFEPKTKYFLQMINWVPAYDAVSLCMQGELNKKESGILKRNVRIYNDYIKINNVSNFFTNN